MAWTIFVVMSTSQCKQFWEHTIDNVSYFFKKRCQDNTKQKRTCSFAVSCVVLLQYTKFTRIKPRFQTVPLTHFRNISRTVQLSACCFNTLCTKWGVFACSANAIGRWRKRMQQFYSYRTLDSLPESIASVTFTKSSAAVHAPINQRPWREAHQHRQA